jgi:hypothetical protein
MKSKRWEHHPKTYKVNTMVKGGERVENWRKYYDGLMISHMRQMVALFVPPTII